MTPTETLQAICEAWNRLDNDALADLFSEDGVFEDPLHERTLRGREDIREVNGPAMGALTECEVTLGTRARARRASGLRRACSARLSPTAADAWTSPSRWSIELQRRAHRAAHRVLRYALRSYEHGRCGAGARAALVHRAPVAVLRAHAGGGAIGFMVYNHTYMPLDYGRDPLVEYRAITQGVTLWDVGAERQAQLRGPDALSFADYLSPRDLLDLAVGRCRFTPVCDPTRRDHGRLHRAAAVRGHRLVLALGLPTSRCGPTASRSRAVRGSRSRRPTSRRCSSRARSPRPCSSRSTTATSPRCGVSTARR